MKSFVEKIKESVPTLVVFRHDGYKDSEKVNELIENLRVKFDGRANIEPVDCSHNGEMKVHYKLQEYPTYILFKEGQELMRESGEKSEAKLTEMIRTAL